MIKWLRRRRFTKALHKVAGEKWVSGEINADQYLAIDKACSDSRAMSRLIAQTTTADGLYGGIKDWDWAAIIAWIKENLIPLLEALIPILMLLGEEEDA